MSEPTKDKLFSRTEYRRVIAWPERIEREAPFLERMLAEAPHRSVLDVGCGTGEHTRHLAEQGWTAVGIDVSEKMIEDASELAGAGENGGSARYELRDVAEAGGLPEAPFGAAICLGNMLAFVDSAEELDRAFAGLASALAPGAPFLLQMLNYDRFRAQKMRNLPVNFRPLPEEEGDGEIVFVRIFSERHDRSFDFYPITLTLQPDEDPPVEVRSARRGKHHAWSREELEAALTKAGFGEIEVRGGMKDVPYEPAESTDVVIRARKE